METTDYNLELPPFIQTRDRIIKGATIWKEVGWIRRQWLRWFGTEFLA